MIKILLWLMNFEIIPNKLSNRYLMQQVFKQQTFISLSLETINCNGGIIKFKWLKRREHRQKLPRMHFFNSFQLFQALHNLKNKYGLLIFADVDFPNRTGGCLASLLKTMMNINATAILINLDNC